MNEIEELLGVEGRRRCRAAAGQACEIVLHRTPLRHIPSIREQGLKPQGQQSAQGVPLDAERLVGKTLRNIICVQTGRKIQPSEFPWVELAIPVKALGDLASVDWSFSGAWEMAAKQLGLGVSVEDAFLEAVRELSSFALYEPVPREFLLVRLKDSLPEMPFSWPRLIDTSDDSQLFVAGSPPSLW